MRIPIYQADAFATRLFGGNPVAVCPLDSWLTDEQMQSIAAENNVAETAFFVRTGDRYQLRWFTPAVEVDLCGHATLASAFILLTRITPDESVVRFDTRSGELTVTRDGELYSMDFPSRPPQDCDEPAGLTAALGGTPQLIQKARDYFVVYGSEDEVRALRPNFAALSELDSFAVIV